MTSDTDAKMMQTARLMALIPPAAIEPGAAGRAAALRGRLTTQNPLSGDPPSALSRLAWSTVSPAECRTESPQGVVRRACALWMTLRRALLDSYDRESTGSGMAGAQLVGDGGGGGGGALPTAAAAAPPQSSLPSSRPSLSTHSLGIYRPSGGSLLKRSTAMERRASIVQQTSLADKVCCCRKFTERQRQPAGSTCTLPRLQCN